MPKKIRIHELAKELDMTNQATLDLCVSLGMAVKSHFSSVEEAQADRARRKARRDGLSKKRDQKSQSAGPKRRAKGPRFSGGISSRSAGRRQQRPSKTAGRVNNEGGISSRSAGRRQGGGADSVDVRQDAVKQNNVADRTDAESARKMVEKLPSSPSGATRKANKVSHNKSVGMKTQGQAVKQQKGSPGKQSGPPLSRSGKPIPPPPRAMATTFSRSRSFHPGGRQGGRPGGGRPGGGRPGGRQGGGRQGGRPGANRSNFGSGSGIPGSRSGPNTRLRRTSTLGGPPRRAGNNQRRATPGGAPGRGAPGRGRGGIGPRRPPQKRRTRRTRKREALKPMDIPTYTPSSVPVPSGVVVIERASTAQHLGPKLNRTAADVVRFLMEHGEMVTATQSLSDEMIELFALDIGANIRLADLGEEQEAKLQNLLEVEEQPDDSESPVRPPVVTVMGHVDHGKTLLLDRIRDFDRTSTEAGGITQHIGAYQVECNSHSITFIDTPGHEAFTAMRARGAEATDIVILVVAADDGVMPQTIEAINHAKAAEVPILVAVNKIDRDNADSQKAIAGVAEHGLVPEAWGGDTIYCEVSALKNIGIVELLDELLVLAEVEDLQASSEGRATGVVLESHLDVGRGAVSTLLVQRGTLKVGDPVVTGASWGRVRALLNDRGEKVLSAGPSTPVQVLGMSNVAEAGDSFAVAPSERIANRVADTREHWQRLSNLGREAHTLTESIKLENIFERIQQGKTTSLSVILKADVNGSLEAITEGLQKLEHDDIRIVFVHKGAGGITENDVQLAAVTNAAVIGFNVRPDRKAREAAESKSVEIRTYEVIYRLLEDIKAAIEGMLTLETEEIITGEATVREIFRIPRVGAVAGCYVQSGTITRGAAVRFLRDGTIIWKGNVSSLKRFAKDVRDVSSGFECGIGLGEFQDLKQGDVIEAYAEREVARDRDRDRDPVG